MVIFEGPLAIAELGDTLREVDGGFLSPGGAAAMLGVSRQYIHKLADREVVRAWSVMEEPELLERMAAGSHKRTRIMFFAYEDLVRYGLRVCRFTRFEDVGFTDGRLTRERFEELRQGVDKSTRIAV